MAISKRARNIAIGLAVFAASSIGSKYLFTTVFNALDNKTAASDFVVGDCLKDVPSGDTLEGATKVDCAETHQFEVYADKKILSTSSSVPDGLQQRAEDFCQSAFAAFDGISYEESTLNVAYIFPTKDGWANGDRLITCIVQDPNKGTNKGSYKNSKL